MNTRFAVFFLISVFYLVICVRAQEFSVTRNLSWKKTVVLHETLQNRQKSEKEFLFFDGAVYFPKSENLPVYAENIPLTNDFINVSGVKIIAETISTEQVSSVLPQTASAQIMAEPVVSAKIKYYRGKPILSVSFIPLIRNQNTGTIEKITTFHLKIIANAPKEYNQNNKSLNYVSNSVLKTGFWVKIKLNKDGIYKLTFDDLKKLGFSNPASVRVFCNNPAMLSFYNKDDFPDDLFEIRISQKNNAIYFFGKSTVKWNYSKNTNFFYHTLHLFSDYSYYYLTDFNTGFDNKIPVTDNNTQIASKIITVFNDYTFHETDSLNLLKSGRQWLGEYFGARTQQTFNFTIANRNTDSLVRLNYSFYGRAALQSGLTINSGSFSKTTFIYPVSFYETSAYANQTGTMVSFGNQQSSNLGITFTYNKPTASAEGWLDFFTLNFYRNLVFTGNQMLFRSTEQLNELNYVGFKLNNQSKNITIWDVTNLSDIKEIQTQKQDLFTIFNAPGGKLCEYIAFDESAFLTPVITGTNVGTVQNQNLHGLPPVEMVIIAHPKFLNYAQQLADLHKANDTISIAVVTTEQIFNEFSAGTPDVSAIRNFARMMYSKSSVNDSLRYLVLFGDGSVDNFTQSARNTNFIPTFQSENSLNINSELTYVSDDYFGQLDNDEGNCDGLLDIGIGRLPVKNTDEAQTAVNKIKAYLDTKNIQDYRNFICFIADDEDNNTHVSQADYLAEYIRNNQPFLNIDKIYIDAFPQVSSALGQSYPEANQRIINRFNKGALIINYTGHGGEEGLAHERILSIKDINSLENITKLPLFITATCEFSRFDEYDRITDQNATSAGEFVFLNPRGGAIALLSTTRVVYSGPNFNLNHNFYKNAFKLNANKSGLRLGDIMVRTKNQTADINMLNFTLLGDPALKLPLAANNIQINTINGINATQFTDTVKALSKIRLTGEIKNKDGERINNYNGYLYPTVYDKWRTVKTLDNDKVGTFQFLLQDNILNKGIVEIKNGIFDFSFIVPKDIQYNYNKGKISLFAKDTVNNTEQACGYFSEFLVGGISQEKITDITGPEIKIYLNDRNFVNGGITNTNPKIIAYINDSSGLNTTGTGIGHDINAVLDGKTYFTLNDFFEPELNNNGKGKAEYILNNLTPGEHTLKVKAWDVYNNSNEQTIQFTVKPDEVFAINHVLNYPNPFTTQTAFYFEHNRYGKNLQVEIQIFSVSGKLVKTITDSFFATGFRSNPVFWNGTDDFGDKIARGVYFYKLKVKTESGENAEKFEKLVIF